MLTRRTIRTLLFLALLAGATLGLPDEAHAYSWSTVTVDSDGEVGEQTSIVVDASGNPMISYHDWTNQDAKFAICDVSASAHGNCDHAGDWSTVAVDSAGGGGFSSSIGVTASGDPVMSYNPRYTGLRFATCDMSASTNGNCDQGGDWRRVTVDGGTDVGVHASIGVDANGDPVISYSDWANGHLRFAICDMSASSNGNCDQASDWRKVTVDTAAQPYQYGATSIAVDANGDPVISYINAAGYYLKFAICDMSASINGNCDQAGDWSTVTVAGGSVTDRTSVAVDGNGDPVISYRSSLSLRFAICDLSASGNGNCDQPGDWSTVAVDSVGEVGQSSSIGVAPDNDPIISYFDWTNKDLKLAACDMSESANGNCDQAGDWSLETVDSEGWVGLYTSIAASATGEPVISYYDYTSADLKFATASPPPALRVGALFSFTGALADYGPVFLNAAQLAVVQVNDAGGVLGGRIHIFQGDTETDPDTGVAEALRLIDTEGVKVIVGAVASGVTIPVAEDATVPNGILQISPASTAPALTTLTDNDLLFRTAFSDAAQGEILAGVGRDLGYATASILYVDDAYGVGLSEVFGTGFEELGGLLLAAVPITLGDGDCEDEIIQATIGGPNVLVVLTYPWEAEDCLIRAIDGGTTSFLFTDGARDEGMFGAVCGAVSEPGCLDGTYGTAHGSLDSAAAMAFDAAYEAEYGEPPPEPFAREAYDAVILTALSAEAAQSSGPSDIRNALRGVSRPGGEVVGLADGGIAYALGQAGLGADIDYEGASGCVDLDAYGDVTCGAVEVWRVEGETIVTDHVESVNTDEDGDWEPRPFDNCPAAYNPGQENTPIGPVDNGPGISGDDETVPFEDTAGDACDEDDDNDGLPDGEDTNPLTGAGLCGTLTSDDGHPSPAGGDVTNDDDGDGDPAPPMGDDSADNGPSWDTDNDGSLDGAECTLGHNPRDAGDVPTPTECGGYGDSDGDGLLDAWETCGWGTDPNEVDSDSDGLGDCVEAADVNGDGVVNFTGDVVYYAKAVLREPAAFGKTMAFDLTKNGRLNFTGDVVELAMRALDRVACL